MSFILPWFHFALLPASTFFVAARPIAEALVWLQADLNQIQLS